MGNSPSTKKIPMGFTPGQRVRESKNSKYQQCVRDNQCKKGLTLCEKKYPLHKRGKYKNARTYWETRSLWDCEQGYVHKYFPRKNKTKRVYNKKRSQCVHRCVRMKKTANKHSTNKRSTNKRSTNKRLTKKQKFIECMKKCKKTHNFCNLLGVKMEPMAEPFL